MKILRHSYISSPPGDDALEREFRCAAERHSGGSLVINVAWANQTGVERLLQAVGAHPASVSVVVGGNNELTSLEAVQRLRGAGATVRVAFYREEMVFHPKRYVFSGGSAGPTSYAALTGSSNLTEGGLFTNHEGLDLVVADTNPQYLKEMHDDQARLKKSPFVYLVEDDKTLHRLYQEGVLVPEVLLKSRQRASRKAQSSSNAQSLDGTLKRMPIPRRESVKLKPVELPFAVKEKLEEKSKSPEPRTSITPRRDPATLDVSDIIYVGTLTDNDVRKVKGLQTGTFEHDLGLRARGMAPEFWGWPNQYQEVIKKKARLEWETVARLHSAETTDKGVLIGLKLWFRDERTATSDSGRTKKHAAEHRVTPVRGPKGESIKNYVPGNFDTNSLFVVERAVDDSDGAVFVIRLITAEETGFSQYQSLITQIRPKHSFGYGAKPAGSPARAA